MIEGIGFWLGEKMKKRIIITLFIVILSCLLASINIVAASTENDSSNTDKATSEITIYTNSGEILKGKLLRETNKAIVIEKYGTSISIKREDILRVEEAGISGTLSKSYKLPFSSVVITYKYTGWQKGKETVYIDAANNKIAIESITTTNIGNMSVEKTTISIYDGETLYTYEPDRKEAIKMEIEGDIISQMFGERFYFGNPIRQEKFLNKECKIYETPMGDMYFWYGIPLKQQTKKHPMGKKFNFTKEAIDITLDVAIPPDKFILPEGTQIKTMDDIFKDMGKMSEEFEESQKQQEQEAKKRGEERKRRDKIRALIDAGRVYEEQGKYKEAIDKYTEAIELNPSSSGGYNERFRVCQIIGENEKAIEDLSILIDMNPPYSQGMRFLKRANIYTRIGKHQEAVNDYTKALEEERKYIKEEIKKKKGAFKQIGEDQEGVEWTEQYRYQIAAIFEGRGDAYRKMRQYDKAIKDFSEGIKQDPLKWLKAKLYFLRGLVYKQLNDQSKMAQDWKIAKSLGSKLREERYVGQKRQGPVIWYHPNGVARIKGNYVDDEWEGPFIFYHTNGKLKSQGNYKKGEKEGIFKWYARTEGYLKKAETYVNGVVEGECKFYHSNGKLFEKTFYKNGVPHGEHFQYYKNGNLRQQGAFKNGKEDGMMILYNQDGSFKKKIIFKNGKKIKEIYNK